MEGLMSSTLGGSDERLFGKFAGQVVDNDDPLRLGRIKARVPEAMGGLDTGWAKPCVPMAGPVAGFFSLPPIGAGVWIEFEAGDLSRPIWTGCFWGDDELPVKPPDVDASPSTHIWRTPGGLTAVLDDEAKTMTLIDADDENKVEVDVETGTVTIKARSKVVIEVNDLREGSESASQQAVLGNNLHTYLAQLVTLFNTHVHPGQLAVGVLPVTPAPPVAQMPSPSPSLLSNTVKLE